MIYFTYNDAPSGIYESQVIDVCRFVNQQFHCDLRLVALISIRGFWANRKKIKSKLPDAIVLPMIPKHSNWRLNKYLLRMLFLVTGRQSIWARGVFAASLALNLKKSNHVGKVIFDGRGAYAAEFKEYLDKTVHIKENIASLEKKVIQEVDFRLAVSEQLINYWRSEYNYTFSSHVVIPCTLNNEQQDQFKNQAERLAFKTSLGFHEKDVVIVYSGSAADWQSMNLLDEFMCRQFSENPHLKLLLLTIATVQDLEIGKKYADRMVQKWVKPQDVKQFLQVADYGFLIRESSVTNFVSSPTKFAEYLNAGLNIIISPGIGDFSTFVRVNNCGMVVDNVKKLVNFKTTAEEERVTNHNLAQKFFSKDAYRKHYQQLTEAL
jgi:hypothetical protein